MGNTKHAAGDVTSAADPIAAEARRTRERLKTMERQNPLRGRVHAGDNSRRADRLEELHDDMSKNEYLAAREARVARLKSLSRAEEKVREGTYGLCDSCGKPIPADRLQAVPGAPHCVPCGERLERGEVTGRQRLWPGEYQLAAA
jgi:RNA polymerase-binding transcription factor DksA